MSLMLLLPRNKTLTEVAGWSVCVAQYYTTLQYTMLISRDPADAAKEKELGNAAYLSKDFETALAHYRAASELEPTLLVYMNNMAAACFGMHKYQVSTH